MTTDYKRKHLGGRSPCSKHSRYSAYCRACVQRNHKLKARQDGKLTCKTHSVYLSRCARCVRANRKTIHVARLRSDGKRGNQTLCGDWVAVRDEAAPYEPLPPGTERCADCLVLFEQSAGESGGLADVREAEAMVAARREEAREAAARQDGPFVWLSLPRPVRLLSPPF